MVRVKRRYILFEVMPHNDPQSHQRLNITEKQLIESLRHTIHELYGDYGLGSVVKSLQLKRLNGMTRTGLVAVKRCHHQLVTSSLPFVRRIHQLDCCLRTIHMSGTIRGCLKALRIHHRKQIVKCRQQLLSSMPSMSSPPTVSLDHKMKSLAMAYKDIELSLQSRPQVSEPMATEDNTKN